MKKELWKPIAEFEHYEVSTLGKVREVKTGELITLSYKDAGYYCYLKRVGSKAVNARMIHILMAAAFLENPNNCKYVAHIDKNRKNNTIENIKYVPYSKLAKSIKGYTPNKKYLLKVPDQTALDKILKLDKEHRDSLNSFKKKPTGNQ